MFEGCGPHEFQETLKVVSLEAPSLKANPQNYHQGI